MPDDLSNSEVYPRDDLEEGDDKSLPNADDYELEGLTSAEIDKLDCAFLDEVVVAAAAFDWDVPEGLYAFEEQYRSDLALYNQTYGNVLHRFVASREDSKPLRFVKWLLKLCPSLLEEKDAEHRTALNLALAPTQPFHEFVDAVLEEFQDDEILARALATPDRAGCNCLHNAIQHKFSSILKLIEKCGPETFIAHNTAGKTPLLMAMDLDVPFRGTTQNLGQRGERKKGLIAQKVVHRQPPELRAKLNGCHSTKSDAMTSRRRDVVSMSKSDLQLRYDPKGEDILMKNDQNSINKGRVWNGNNGLATEESKRPRLGPHASTRYAAIRGQMKSTSTGTLFKLSTVVQSLMKKSEKSLSIVSRSDNKTPYQYRLSLLSKGDPASTKNDIIAQDIKEFCLRTLPRDEAIQILYEQGKEKHIEFDLSSLPSSSISKDDLNRLARHLTFEDTLMYVALPRLRIEDTDGHNDPAPLPTSTPSSSSQNKKVLARPIPDASKSASQERLGIADAKIVFEWLRLNGVRRIFKVIVVDNGEVPHSDEAIEEALKDFQIETWDWKKIDICSNTIVHAAGEDVKTVNLYSSGNNAVLKGWSCEAGLASLKSLEHIHLVIRRGFETEHRREQHILEFKRTLKSNWEKLYSTKSVPSIKVTPDDKPESFASGFQINNAPEQKQEWLRRMDEFATFISLIDLKKEEERIEKERETARSQGASEDDLPPEMENIRVAVIDDGIDGFETDLSESIAHGVSFCRSSDSENLIRTYYVSSGGHGTIMARLIRRMCPTVKLYVARLEEYKFSSGRRFITPRSAADAVKWAIINKVHIISMSWSIEGSDNDNDIKELKRAIESAKSANITMFCAFSDQGNNSSEKTFPATWDECITVGAATPRGNASTFVDKNKVDFLFPGEQIVIDSKTPDPTLASPPPKAENGSSISTALAAGTAALLLHIAQLVKPAFYQKLQEPGRMKKAFQAFCPSSNDNYFQAQTQIGKEYATNTEWEWDDKGKHQVDMLLNRLMNIDEQQSINSN